MTATTSAAEANDRELVVERVFDPPRELDLEAWTDPERVARWWGPKGFTNPVSKLEGRPGVAILIHRRGPDGTVSPSKGVVRGIVAPERLVLGSNAGEDEAGEPRLDVPHAVTFAEHDGKTGFTPRAVVVGAAPELDAALEGLEDGRSQSLDRLAEGRTPC